MRCASSPGLHQIADKITLLNFLSHFFHLVLSALADHSPSLMLNFRRCNSFNGISSNIGHCDLVTYSLHALIIALTFYSSDLLSSQSLLMGLIKRHVHVYVSRRVCFFCRLESFCKDFFNIFWNWISKATRTIGVTSDLRQFTENTQRQCQRRQRIPIEVAHSNRSDDNWITAASSSSTHELIWFNFIFYVCFNCWEK